MPGISLRLRQSDYGGDASRSRPRLVGVGIDQDLGWLFAGRSSASPVAEARTRGASATLRGIADYDTSQGLLQLAVGEASVLYRASQLQIALRGGGSWYQDEALIARVGARGVAGYQGELDVSFQFVVTCVVDGTKEPCGSVTFTGSGEARDSWAEELRYVVEYAGLRQTLVYLELTVGL